MHRGFLPVQLPGLVWGWFLGLPALFRRKKPEDKTSQSGFWSSVRSWLWTGVWLLDALGRRKTYLETNIAHTGKLTLDPTAPASQTGCLFLP